MNSAIPPVIRRRRWPWVLAAVLLAPVGALALIIYSYATLDRDASALRRQVMSASGAEWTTKFQASLGRATFAVVRGGLALVESPDLAEARTALAVLRHASVGVYQLRTRHQACSQKQLINDTDEVMHRRGWDRIVGVVDGADTVLVYVPEFADEPDRVCLAVVSDDDLVVVSATLKPAALLELVSRHAGGDLRAALRRHI